VARETPRRVRWIEEADDPDLEAQLLRELEARRDARHEVRRQREVEKRARRLFWLFSLLVLALVGTIGYGVLTIARTIFT